MKDDSALWGEDEQTINPPIYQSVFHWKVVCKHSESLQKHGAL